MDPLSITASIVAIVGAGGSLASGLRRIYALKDAPDDLLQLHEELSQIQLLVSAIQESCRQRGKRVSAEDQCDEFIFMTLRRSRDDVLNVEKLIAYDLTKVSSNGDKLDRGAWLGAQSKVQRAKDCLRETRSSLTGILNVSLLRHLEAQSASVRLGIEEFGRRQEMAEELIRKMHETKGLQIQEISQDREHIHIDSIFAESSSTLEVQSRLSAPKPHPESSYTSKVSRGETDIKLSQFESFSSSCSCSCHTRDWLKSPKMLQSVLGSLVMGHNSFPFLTRRCDNLACRDHSAPSLTASYAFPRWFAHRIISIRATSEAKRGPELLLRVWRVRPWNSNIFLAVQKGRTNLVKHLFDTGGASVFDVTEEGTSLLNFAIQTAYNVEETILLLISAGADIMQEDRGQISPYMLWWNEVLLPRRYSLLSQLEHFGAVPIPDNLGFFDLHASVLGLGSKPFNIVLRNTPRSDVDMPDRMGRTALHLAAQRGDVSMVKELLAKGADPNLEDLRGQVPLLLWANYHPTHNWSSDQSAENCENMLDILGTHKAVNHRDRNGRSVSHHVLYFDSGIVAALEKLKSLGVNFEDKHHPIRPLIIEATVANRESCQVIPWLLENGCDINCRGSPTGQTSIMYAVFHQKYETLDLLLHRGADYALLHKGQRNIVHYAASYSYLRILEILCQHPLERLYLDAKDVHGWTPLDNARWRRDFNYYWSNWAMKEPDEDPVLWYNAFKALYRHIAESQGLDYNWESEEDSEEDSEQDSEQDTEDHSTDSANTEYSLRPAIPGSYPDT